MEKIFIPVILLLLALPHSGSSQDSLTFDLRYEVNRIYPEISITRENLIAARTLIDLDTNYNSSWIREYLSVEILTRHNGRIRNAMGKNSILTQEQKGNMNTADAGTEITVKVHYMPENTLKNNDSKEINFTFTVDPESDASYPGGQSQLNQYLKENIMDKISASVFRKYNLAAVKFTVNEEGQIIDTHVSWPSSDEKTNELLLAGISNMPRWNPAEYANGVKVKQEFAFTVGDMESCVINLINIRKE